MTYFSPPLNRKTKKTTSILGILLAMAGIVNHGIFEIFQGNTPTNGYFIEAIGKAHRFWVYGTEAAFTIIHNFLITGIFVVLVGLAIIVWSVKYLQLKHGTTVFLILLILLALVGGGIGYLIVIIPTWAFATQVNKSLDWWKKVLSDSLRKTLSALWVFSLSATTVSWLVVMELGIFGYFPGLHNPDAVLNIVFIFLFSTVLLACITFICAFAGDIEERKT